MWYQKSQMLVLKNDRESSYRSVFLVWNTRPGTPHVNNSRFENRRQRSAAFFLSRNRAKNNFQSFSLSFTTVDSISLSIPAVRLNPVREALLSGWTTHQCPTKPFESLSSRIVMTKLSSMKDIFKIVVSGKASGWMPRVTRIGWEKLDIFGLVDFSVKDIEEIEISETGRSIDLNKLTTLLLKSRRTLETNNFSRDLFFMNIEFDPIEDTFEARGLSLSLKALCAPGNHLKGSRHSSAWAFREPSLWEILRYVEQSTCLHC